MGGGNPSSSAHGARSTALRQAAMALLPSSAAADEAAPQETEEQRAERMHHQAMLNALGDDRVTDMDTLRAAVRAHKRRAEEDERRAKGLEAPREIEDGEEVHEGVLDQGLPGSPVEAAQTVPGEKAAADAAIKGKPQQQRQSQGAVPRRWAIDDGKEYPILTERAAAVARWVLEAPPVGADGGGGRKKKKKSGGARTGGATAGTDADVELAGPVGETEV
jgi:hypothetical protein